MFCQIVSRKIPAEIVFEDDQVLAFRDIHPLAPVHILIIPKKHWASLNDLTNEPEDATIAGRLILTGKKLAKQEGIDQTGYKLLFRTGRDGGQEVGHIHLHLIGGAPLFEEIRPL